MDRPLADPGEVLILDDVGKAGRWSSSRVRDLLSAGDMAGAAEILGRPHLVSGEVVHGDHRGRKLGYPTANLCWDLTGLIPADGVYAGRLIRPTLHDINPDHALPAAISVGTNPTFAGTERRVEAYVLDRVDLDLYGETVVMEFFERLRATEKFDTIAELVDQMADDVARTRWMLCSVVDESGFWKRGRPSGAKPASPLGRPAALVEQGHQVSSGSCGLVHRSPSSRPSRDHRNRISGTGFR